MCEQMITCCVVGLGYIGLPTAAVLARAGHHVLGVDVNPQVVATVNEGRIHIVGPTLIRLCQRLLLPVPFRQTSYRYRLTCS